MAFDKEPELIVCQAKGEAGNTRCQKESRQKAAEQSPHFSVETTDDDANNLNR